MLLTTVYHRMWINESVFSAAYTYKWGIALPIWWASGLSFQIALMVSEVFLSITRINPKSHDVLLIRTP